MKRDCLLDYFVQNKIQIIILHQTKNLTLQKDIYINIQQIIKITFFYSVTLIQTLQVDNKGAGRGDPKVTPNGKRLININNNFKLKILSKSPKCKGKWTRINTKNENEKSIIDYALYTQAPTHSFTEAQVGAREGRSSVEQLFILKSVIQLRTFQRKQTYCTYTWREGMFYNLWQRGVR